MTESFLGWCGGRKLEGLLAGEAVEIVVIPEAVIALPVIDVLIPDAFF